MRRLFIMLHIDFWCNICYIKHMEKKHFFSTAEVAKMLSIDRVTVFRKIKSGEIKAHKVGRNFVIAVGDLPEVLGTVVSKKQGKEINDAVKKAVRQYGETFRLLGRE